MIEKNIYSPDGALPGPPEPPGPGPLCSSGIFNSGCAVPWWQVLQLIPVYITMPSESFPAWKNFLLIFAVIRNMWRAAVFSGFASLAKSILLVCSLRTWQKFQRIPSDSAQTSMA